MAPVAFGLCSIVGMLLIVLIGDLLHDHLGLPTPFDAPMAGTRRLLIGAAIYVIPGIAGAWLAISVAGKIEPS